MGRTISRGTKKAVQPVSSRLTEENLRLHCSAHIKRDSACDLAEGPMWATLSGAYHENENDLDGSDDGDVDMKRYNLALRRAASLEALKAYGGCFASGFLAMQEPLPWTSRRTPHEDVEGLDIRELVLDMASVETGSVQVSSNTTRTRAGCPRPDSDTLSHADIQELNEVGRWSWKFIGKRRRNAANKWRI